MPLAKRLSGSYVSSPFAEVASWYSAPQLALSCASDLVSPRWAVKIQAVVWAG